MDRKTLYIDGERSSREQRAVYSEIKGRHPKALRHRPQGTHRSIQEIGKGAYGKIYLGRQRESPKTVRAIKMISKTHNNSMFMSEALILKQLDHPNVLKLYSIFEDPHTFYLVTE